MQCNFTSTGQLLHNISGRWPTKAAMFRAFLFSHQPHIIVVQTNVCICQTKFQAKIPNLSTSKEGSFLKHGKCLDDATNISFYTENEMPKDNCAEFSFNQLSRV